MKEYFHAIRFIFFVVLALLSLVEDTDAQEKERKAVITTEFGDMIVKLYNETPLHRDNFIKNVTSGWYDGTLFHRVIPYFMMQGGDPNSINALPDQALGSDRCRLIPAEIIPGKFHKKGALAAARLPDNMNPDRSSSGCQFFIVHGFKHNDNQLNSSAKKLTPFQRAWYKVRGGSAFLDNDYTVFGEVIEGLEIIDLICAVETHNTGGIKDRPIQDVRMTIKMID